MVAEEREREWLKENGLVEQQLVSHASLIVGRSRTGEKRHLRFLSINTAGRTKLLIVRRRLPYHLEVMSSRMLRIELVTCRAREGMETKCPREGVMDKNAIGRVECYPYYVELPFPA